MHVFYLHGFASSSQSSKAAFFGAKLAERGATLHVPDFNEPDFSTLTITRMVEQTLASIGALAPGPVALIGSSLGAFVAVQVALRRSTAEDRLVLLAPALDFGGNRMRALGDRGLDAWQETNRLDVFHYGFGRMMRIHYDLYADASRYNSLEARPQVPIQIFQGRRDTAVDPATVEAWAAARPNVELHMLDDDHQLGGSLDYLWREIERFIFLSAEVPSPTPGVAQTGP